MWYSWIIQTKWVEMAAWDLTEYIHNMRYGGSKQRLSLIHVPDRRGGQGPNRNTISRGRGGGGSCPKRVLAACVDVCPSFSRFLCWIFNNDTEYFAYQETIPRVQVRMLKEMPLEIWVFRSERQDYDTGCLWLVILTPQPCLLIGSS